MQNIFYKKLSSLLALVLLVSFTSVQAQVMETEPNNTPGTANIIPLNGSASGAISPVGDVDWYQLTTTGDGQLNITLNNTGNQDLKDITLYDNDGVTSLKGVSVGNGIGGFIYNGVAAGTFYIKVIGHSGNETGAYTLSDLLLVPARANDQEPNNTIAQADRLNLNDSTQGHLGYYYNNHRDTTDWYKVTTNADGQLNIILDNTGNGDLKTVRLFDTTGTPLLNSQNVGNGIGGLNTNGLAAGTYYIQIIGTDPNDFGAYLLSDTLITLARAKDQEPNNTILQADRLNLNDSTQGHLGYYYNNHRDTTDWYKVTTNADGQLNIILDNTGNNDQKTVNVFDTTGNPLLNSQNVGNGIGGLNTTGLAAGTYYIQIIGTNSNDFGAYLLSDTLITTARPNDKEPNNTFSVATPLAINDTTDGHYGYYYAGKRDTADWYKINITSRGRLQLVLDNTGNAGLETLNLYDASGTTLVKGTNVGNGVGGFESDTLSPGIYYIQIISGAGGNYNTFGPYQLSDSLFTALPVTLVNFNGKITDNIALLSWSTETENNNKGFEVQKSLDGHSFAAIGFVNGAGNSSAVNTYNYTDIKILGGDNYYRLKQIDIDRNFSYSPTIRLNYKHFDWAILGNPVTSASWMQLQLTKTTKVAIQVLSVNGKVINIINKGTISAGTYSIPLNLGNAPAGIYTVRLLTDDGTFAKKVTK
ncbi:MAG: T9SS type A sorting domain-containing protein [Ginsengibacter sp.]